MMNNKTALDTNNPIINCHEIDWPKAEQVRNTMAESDEPFEEYMSAGCTASVPAGARKIYIIIVTTAALVGGLLMWGVFKLLDL